MAANVDANVVTLLETKLRAPGRRRGVVPRARLVERLGGVDLPAVVLVSAPAGFGETTPLAEWLDMGVSVAVHMVVKGFCVPEVIAHEVTVQPAVPAALAHA